MKWGEKTATNKNWKKEQPKRKRSVGGESFIPPLSQELNVTSSVAALAPPAAAECMFALVSGQYTMTIIRLRK